MLSSIQLDRNLTIVSQAALIYVLVEKASYVWNIYWTLRQPVIENLILSLAVIAVILVALALFIKENFVEPRTTPSSTRKQS